MNEKDLQRLEAYYTGNLPMTEPLGLCRAYDAMEDVPALVAEIRRLRKVGRQPPQKRLSAL